MSQKENRLNVQAGDIVAVRETYVSGASRTDPPHLRSFNVGERFVVTRVSRVCGEDVAYGNTQQGGERGIVVGLLDVKHRFQLVRLDGRLIIMNFGTRTAHDGTAGANVMGDDKRLEGLRNNFLRQDSYPLSRDAIKDGAHYKLFNEVQQRLFGKPPRDVEPKPVKPVDDSLPGFTRDELRDKLRTKNKHLSSVLRELDDELARHAITQDNLRRSLESHADLTRLLQRERATIAELQAKLLPVGGLAICNQNIAKPVDMLEAFTTYCATAGLSFTIANTTK